MAMSKSFISRCLSETQIDPWNTGRRVLSWRGTEEQRGLADPRKPRCYLACRSFDHNLSFFGTTELAISEESVVISCTFAKLLFKALLHSLFTFRQILKNIFIIYYLYYIYYFIREMIIRSEHSFYSQMANKRNFLKNCIRKIDWDSTVVFQTKYKWLKPSEITLNFK